MRLDTANDVAPIVDEASIARPPAPRAYERLRSGPDAQFSWEDAESAPIDGSDALLRQLSPFVLRVEPPLILDSEPSVSSGDGRSNAQVGIYGQANRLRGGFGRARDALSRARYVASDWGTASPDQWIARGSGSRVTGASSDGRAPSSPQGQVPTTNLGVPSIADLRVAMDIASQLSAIMRTPPLVLLVNPASMQQAYAKIQQQTDRTRYGYVFQAWGEEQAKISITAKCGAFISGGRGVQMASRRDSAAWQNLMTAFQFYKNNGYIYDTVGKSNAHHMVGALSISYDQWTYVGHMESFNWTYDENNQNGGVEFQIEFVAGSVYDGAQASFGVAPMANPLSGGSADVPAQGLPGRGPALEAFLTDFLSDSNATVGPSRQSPIGTGGFRKAEIAPATVDVRSAASSLGLVAGKAKTTSYGGR